MASIIAARRSWDEDGQDTDRLPERLSGSELDESVAGVGVAAPADDYLRNEDGKGEQDGRDYVYQDENGSSVLAHHIREAPKVTETNGRPGQS